MSEEKYALIAVMSEYCHTFVPVSFGTFNNLQKAQLARYRLQGAYEEFLTVHGRGIYFYDGETSREYTMTCYMVNTEEERLYAKFMVVPVKYKYGIINCKGGTVSSAELMGFYTTNSLDTLHNKFDEVCDDVMLRYQSRGARFSISTRSHYITNGLIDKFIKENNGKPYDRKNLKFFHLDAGWNFAPAVVMEAEMF